MSSNLVGKWKLVREGSDIMPGLENMPGAPLVLKLLGESTAEFYKIDKKKVLEIEEISLAYVTKNASVNKSVQVGTLNFEQITNQDVTLSMIQNVDDDFSEFSLVRLGPKSGQNSKETYTLDSSLNKLKLQVEITADDGTRLNLIKYLVRFDREKGPSTDLVLNKSADSQGWRIFDFWPTTTLTNTKVSIIHALKIKTPTANGKAVESVWSKPDEYGAVDIDRFKDQYQLSDGEEVVEFVIRVVLDDKVWIVAHRYKEFDALRRFLLIQNAHVTSFKENDAKFPKKGVGLGYRRTAWIQQRGEGLEQFLVFFLINARYCKQNSVDALCSFLQIPENLGRTAKTLEINNNTSIAASSVKPASSNNNASAAASLIRAVETPPAEPVRPVSSVQSKPATPQPPVAPSPAKSTAVVKPPTQVPIAVKAPVTVVSMPSKSPATVTTSSSSSANNHTIPSVTLPATTSSNTAPSGKSAMSDSVCQTISCSANRAQQVARETLFASLEKGLTVVKHGRQGNPHSRVLQCDAGVTKLFWQPSEGKAISVADIAEIRRGTDLDRTATSPAAVAAYESKPAAPSVLTKKKSVRMSILMTGAQDDEVYFGTANLRRHCKAENMPLCISLILPDRTFDIQCSSLEDFDLLYHNLNILMRK